MVLEMAHIVIKQGFENEFETNVKTAHPLFLRAAGCTGMELQRSVETPNRYVLIVKWDTVEDHTVKFRGSEDFQAWRKLVGHCFASPPDVGHTQQVV
jgi:heme-degrading monooxygenase HmoA